MEDGKGYMYYSTGTASQTFTYPSEDSAGRSRMGMGISRNSSISSRWSTDVGRYSSTMTITAIVLNNNAEIRSDQIEIAAFSGTECRGSAILQHVADLDKYIGFLMIHGDGAETITLRVYDHAEGTEHIPNNAPLPFTADAIHGNPANPYVVTLSGGTDPNLTGTENITLSQQVSVYPNPASALLYIAHLWESIDILEIVDAGGRIVYRQKDFTEASIDISDMAAGVYLLRIIKDEQSVVIRFVKE